MNICFDCKKEINPVNDLVDFDEDGNIYHWECLSAKRSCEAEQMEL